MNCKISHTADSLPQSLCRTCHPELNITQQEREEFAIRASAARERLSVEQELLRTRQKLSSMSRDGEPDPCYVPVKARVYSSLQRKAKRLQDQLDKMTQTTHA